MYEERVSDKDVPKPLQHCHGELFNAILLSLLEPVSDCNRYYSELVLHTNPQYLNFIILNTRKFYNLHMGGHKSIR